MKMARIGTLLLTYALAVPSFSQQKTYSWVQGNDETVRLDPGYYHTSPPYQPGPGARSMHVEIDAQRPVILAVVSLQSWNDAGQRPESMAGLSMLCVQEHVVQTTYSCDVPLGIPTVLLVHDERGERGTYAGRGEVTRGRDHDKQQASQPEIAQRTQAQDADADRDRDHHDAGRAIAAAVDTWTGNRARRQFASANDVHIQYYDWACTDNCTLPDPPRPKLFDWVPKPSQADRLDPGDFFEGETWNFPQKEITYHLDVEARKPVTIAVVEAQDWNDAVAQSGGKTLSNINYICIQQHVTKATFACTIPIVWRPTFMVVRDERDPLPPNQYGQAAGGQATAVKPGQPSTQPGVQASAVRIFQRANPALTQNPAPSTNAAVTASDAPRSFLAANDIRLTPYVWQCVDACDQPDYAWAFQVNESYTLSGVKIYGGAVIPDHDGEQINIHVKSPVPMAVAMLRPKTAFRVINQADQLESELEKSPCVQRGVQESSFQCTFNLSDGPQSLVLSPEPGVDIPAHKKTEVALQAYKCVDNCAGPSFAWVGAVHEKYQPTGILKMYSGFTADHDGEQVSVKIKSPVPMTAAMLPTRQASQLYGKPQLFDEQVQSSSCGQRNVQDSVFQCTIDIADGSQSLVVRPEPGYSLPKDKKAEVEIQTMKCVAKCDGIAPSH